MQKDLNETTYFRYCRTLDGRLEPVDFARRNNKRTPCFRPPQFEPPTQARSREFKRLLREVMYGLNRLERRTWLQLLLGISIIDIARKEKVSRSAIYERIRGNSKGQGGMIRKSDYVLIWWRDQRKKGQQ